jgi:hypothetical protein
MTKTSAPDKDTLPLADQDNRPLADSELDAVTGGSMVDTASQAMRMLGNATNEVIKNLGDALSTVARKQ